MVVAVEVDEEAGVEEDLEEDAQEEEDHGGQGGRVYQIGQSF